MISQIVVRRFSSLKLGNTGPWIGGKFELTGSSFNVVYPANSTVVGTCTETTNSQVSEAINLAHAQYQSGIWSKMDVRDRCRVLFDAARILMSRIPELAEKETLQTGRAVREMKAQLMRLPEWFEYFGSLARTQEGTVPPFFGPYINYVKRIPLGVVAQITPWNHPLLIAIKKLAPALATGNSVVLKPSELAPISVLQLGPILKEAGIPDGVVNILPGQGPTVGKLICQNPLIRKVDLTGGTNTGRLVGAAAGSNLASVTSELGGKAPMIIFPDVDIQECVNGCVFASFVASGQTCITGARLLIHESIYKQYLQAFVNKVKGIRLGDPMDLETQMGPVISFRQQTIILEMIARAEKEGGRIATGGKIPSNPSLSSGCFIEPTVIDSVSSTFEIFQKEVFGPVVTVTTFKDEADAIRLANDSPYGLAAAVWTKDVKRAHRVCEKLNVGIVWINDHHRNDPSSPWGGMGESGIGRENGIEAYREYTQTKSVIVSTSSDHFDWFEQKNARYS